MTDYLAPLPAEGRECAEIVSKTQSEQTWKRIRGQPNEVKRPDY